MKILGIDEAGRGPVIGPLIVCGVLASPDEIEIMDKMGIKDSKKITPKKRKFLYRKIKRIAESFVVRISALDIDNLRAKNINLNEIEKIAIMKIIKDSKAKSVIIDSVDVNPSRFERELIEVLGPGVEVKAEHSADDKYVVVAAASIIAKVERDIEIEKLARKYKKLGELGSGYPSDPRTKTFLKNFNYDNLPDFVRKSWSTVEKLKDDKQ